MSTFSNASKHSPATFSNASKNSASFMPYAKGGAGLPYDSPAAYDDALDPISGDPLLYDTAGTLPVWTNQPKS